MRRNDKLWYQVKYKQNDSERMGRTTDGCGFQTVNDIIPRLILRKGIAASKLLELRRGLVPSVVVPAGKGGSNRKARTTDLGGRKSRDVDANTCAELGAWLSTAVTCVPD